MNKTNFSYLALLAAVILLFSACASSGQPSGNELPISYPDAFADVTSISDGRLRAFGLTSGVSYQELVNEIFSENELDLQFYAENGKVTIKDPLTFSETGNEDWLVSFFFVDDRLTRIAAGITFLDTPLSEASACISVLREAYQKQFGDEVYFLEQGPSLEDLANGDSGSWSVEWLLDEGGVRVSAKNRDDLKRSGITEQDLCLEASVIFVL